MPLTGTATFTPVAGKSYELLVELKGNPLDLDGPGEKFCSPFVLILDNGVPLNGAGLWADASSTPPFNLEPIGTSSAAIALQAAGQPQALTALAFGSAGCAPGAAASLRAVVVELG